MSKISPVEHRLARLLDTPLLAKIVPHLPTEALHELIRDRGLDACVELVTSATSAQLISLVDLDLWCPAAPGCDEQFGVARFAEWIEVLVDAGPSLAARTVAALEQDLVIAGLSRYVRVFDPGIFEPTAQRDDEPIDRHEAMREGDSVDADGPPLHRSRGDLLECEVGGYIIRGRSGAAWDAIVALLVALDAEYSHDFHAIMRGCRRLSNSTSESDGLDDLLLPADQHLHDVTIERERRRSQQGYATPADARAFLAMARQSTDTRLSTSAPIGRNPIVTAYFRAAEEAPVLTSEEADPVPSGSIRSALRLLTEAGLMPERPWALLEAGDAGPHTARLTVLRRLMAYLHDRDEPAYFTRGRELAFLANTLLAGCSVQSRPFTAREASDAAAGICNLGLEYWPARWPSAASPRASGVSAPQSHDAGERLPDGSRGGSPTPRETAPPDPFLIEHDLVTAFEVGWSALHQEVGLFAADQLISLLPDVDGVDRDTRSELGALRRTLVEQRNAGTPWRARAAAEILARLDLTAWIGVIGLLDECPIVPEALLAVLERRTTTVSPTAFDFISTTAQIGDVRMFLQRLPGLLSG